MASGDFTLDSTFDASAGCVYDAIATRDGIRGWWTRHTTFDDQVGSVAEMRFPEAGFHARFRVTALQPSSRIAWECIDSEHPAESGFSDLKEWDGTSVIFEIEPLGEKRSRLRFTHVGLVPRLECNDQCRSVWGFYINTSLRALVETGEGEPYGG